MHPNPPANVVAKFTKCKMHWARSARFERFHSAIKNPENFVKIYQWPQITINGCGKCQKPKHYTSWQLSQIQPEPEMKIPACLHIQCFVPCIQIRWICQRYSTLSLSDTQSSAKVKSSEKQSQKLRCTHNKCQIKCRGIFY